MPRVVNSRAVSMVEQKVQLQKQEPAFILDFCTSLGIFSFSRQSRALHLVLCHSLVGRVTVPLPGTKLLWELHVAGDSTKKFHKVPATALQSPRYGHENVGIKQLLPGTTAVKFVYEVNFNKKQTVSVVYKQSRAVKSRECFVNARPWAR